VDFVELWRQVHSDSVSTRNLAFLFYGVNLTE